MSLLEVADLWVWYGGAVAVRGVSLRVSAGDVVALCGPNGAGKTSLLRALGGLDHASDSMGVSGSMAFDGREVIMFPGHLRARAGVGFCPDRHGAFATLSVAENIAVSGRLLSPRDFAVREHQMYELFPQLGNRRDQVACTLSGGERQMLALAMTFMPKPKLLLLDEPTQGLAVHAAAQLRGAIQQMVRDESATVIVAEEDAGHLPDFVRHRYVMHAGVFTEDSASV
ncbi:MAG: ABC transporter ATP-binding protein [Gemmatimonadaceae bacterium]